MNFYVVPSNYLYPTAETVSVNGSSPIGNCLNVTLNIGTRFRDLSRCEVPTSSVLFDGNTPTLTGLDGNMWASQLLTLQLHNSNRRDIIFDFRGAPNYTGVELVMFNCPEWGIGVEVIEVQGATSPVGTTRSSRGSFRPTITSCDSLMRVCIISPLVATETVTILRFTPATGSDRTYLAEVRFYGDSTDCSPDTITPPDTTPPPPLDIPAPQPPDITAFPPQDTTIPNTTQETASEHAEIPSTSPSCTTSTVLASVITSIASALLATVISVLVTIAVCKCHPKFTPGGTETATSAGGEGQEYEEVDGGKGGVAVSDPTYMEVGERRGGNTFQLKENEAYASTTHN